MDMKQNTYDVLIIGAGVIGGLIARELSKYALDILIIDKENDVCNGTSAANSAIVHAGYDPRPGSLKARFNVEAVPMYKTLCEDLDVEFKTIGSLIVAREESDFEKLYALEERAKVNGVKVKVLTKQETLKMEPNLNPHVAGALYAPTAGIVNPFELTAHAIENAINNGATLALNNKVIAITKENDVFTVTTSKATYQAKVIINAAGVYADNITNLISKATFSITPRKGSYFVIDKLAAPLVNSVVFPLPSAHSKGILVVPTTAGNFLIGPTSEEIMNKFDVGTDYASLNYIKEEALKLVPNIPFAKTIRTFSGLRATPSTGDFVIENDPLVAGLINVAGIESPGLASAPAIAKYVVSELVSKHLSLKENLNFNPRIRPLIRPKRMSEEEKATLASKDASYSQIICNCEQVTKGEILDLLSRPIPIKSIKAIKKRLRAGFGMCQGGFCTPRVMQILADYYQIPLSEVLYDEEESYLTRHENI